MKANVSTEVDDLKKSVKEYKGYTVSFVKDNAFTHSKNLRSITITSSLKAFIMNDHYLAFFWM